VKGASERELSTKAEMKNHFFSPLPLPLFLGQPHTKNWRPQLLVLVKLNDDLMPKYRKMFAFVSQLKAGKGLTVCMSVIPGDFVKRHSASVTAKQNLRKYMDDERVKGFVDVLVTKNVADGLSNM
jgi:potassium/chloride transporter 4/5/6